jgi:hypothetical protein
MTQHDRGVGQGPTRGGKQEEEPGPLGFSP